MENSDKYILTHNNKDNFIFVFNNYTKADGETIYKNYIQNNYRKDINSVLDNLNNIKNSNTDTWDYDLIKGKFILPDESNFSIYFKFY